MAPATVGDKARRDRGVAPARPSLLAVGLCRLILQPGVPAPQRCPAGALPGKAGVGSGEEKTGRIVIARNGCNSKTFHVSCAASPDPFRVLGPTRAFLAVSERACPADAVLKASSARGGPSPWGFHGSLQGFCSSLGTDSRSPREEGACQCVHLRLPPVCSGLCLGVDGAGLISEVPRGATGLSCPFPHWNDRPAVWREVHTFISRLISHRGDKVTIFDIGKMMRL